MTRVRFSKLRHLRRKLGTGLLIAMLTALPAAHLRAQSKKPAARPPKPVSPAKTPPTPPKAPANPAGAKPPAAEDLYEGPEHTNPSAQKPATSAPPTSDPATLPKYADAWPSEFRPAPRDLLPGQQEEDRAAAVAAYAEAEAADSRGDADKAMEHWKKAAALDSRDSVLAIKVAREFVKRNDPSAAIQVLKDSIATTPDQPRTYIYLSRIYADQLGKPDLAIQQAQKALEIAPDHFPAWQAAFEHSGGDGAGKRRAELIEKASRSQSKDAVFWVQFGQYLLSHSGIAENRKLGDEDRRRIEAIYRKAIELAPQDAATIAQAGDFFTLIRDYKHAVEFFERADALNQPATHPSLERLREKIIKAMLQGDRRMDAVPLLEKLVASQPSRPDLAELLAETYEQTGQTDKALEYYQRSLALDLADPTNHLELAERQLAAKKFDLAIRTLQSAREKFAGRPRVTFGLALAYSGAKKHETALATFEEVVKEAKEKDDSILNDRFYFQYGAAAEQAGKFEKAAELLKKAIELNPDTPEPYNYLGYMWADRGEKLDEAGALIKKALEIEPSNGAYLDSLGWWYFKSGKFEEARKELERAVQELSEEDAVVYDHLGDAFDKLGKKDEALKYWKKAHDLESEDPAKKQKLAEKIAAAKKK